MELMRLIGKHDREVNESTLHSLLSLVVPCTKTLHMLADCYAMSFWRQPADSSDNWTDAKNDSFHLDTPLLTVWIRIL
jgi:hypothetical protein